MLLFAILAFGISTMWMPQRWALAGFQLTVLVCAAFRARTLRFGPTGLVLAAIVAWGGVQSLAGWSADAFRTQVTMLDWVVNLAVFALALELSADPARRERFLNFALLFASAMSVLAMLTAPREFFGPFVYRNQYAAFVEALLPLALLRAFLDRERAWAYALASGLLFASVISSGSRTGAILCSLEVVAVPLMVRSWSAWRATLGIGLSLGVLTLAAGWQPLWNRFQEPHPYSLRWDLFQSSLEMWLARPWTGWGLGTWPLVYPGFARYDDGTFVNQAHNDWAQWAVEGGLPMLAGMLFVAGRALIPAFRSVWGIGLLSVFAHCFFDYPMQQRPALAAFFFALLGMLMGVRPTQVQPEIPVHKPLGRT